MVLVARRHWRDTAVRNGLYESSEGAQEAVIIDQLWHSDVLLGTAALDSAWEQWPTGGASPFRVEMEPWEGLRTTQGAAWRELCVVETWIPANRTLIRHVVTGPEDPKVLDVGGETYVTFDSKKPHGGDVEGVCRRNQQGLLDAVTQMCLDVLSSSLFRAFSSMTRGMLLATWTSLGHRTRRWATG